MIKKNVYMVVKDAIATKFNISKDIISPQTTSDDIEEWDSLGHIQLILKLESIFNIKFNIVDIPKLTSIQAILTELKKYEKSS